MVFLPLLDICGLARTDVYQPLAFYVLYCCCWPSCDPSPSFGYSIDMSARMYYTTQESYPWYTNVNWMKFICYCCFGSHSIPASAGAFAAIATILAPGWRLWVFTRYTGSELTKFLWLKSFHDWVSVMYRIAIVIRYISYEWLRRECRRRFCIHITIMAWKKAIDKWIISEETFADPARFGQRERHNSGRTVPNGQWRLFNSFSSYIFTVAVYFLYKTSISALVLPSQSDPLWDSSQ